MRALIHSFPGIGKSRVTQWVIRMFTEALKWEYGIEFGYVAFQNRVAYAMNATTLHTGGGMVVGQQDVVFVSGSALTPQLEKERHGEE